MRELISLLFMFYCYSFLFSQETIQAIKETLTRIPVGENTTEITYKSTDEGFYSPTGPLVDKDGSLFFYPLAGLAARNHLVKFSNGSWSNIPLFDVMKKSGWDGNAYQFISNAGYVISKSNDYVFNPKQNSNDILFERSMITGLGPSKDRKHYVLPKGDYFESFSPKWIYSTEELQDYSIKLRNLEETIAWLPTQPGGFTIGGDGFLYRNGSLYSALQPKKTSYAGKYVGRLMSGHTVWSDTKSGQERHFVIATPAGFTELEIDIPWGQERGNYKPCFYNWGLGPWGEIYCLIPPDDLWIDVSSWSPDKLYDMNDMKNIKDPAELVVVRNHLKYFGRLNDGGVRLRKEPNTTSDILGTYLNKTGFRILETGTKEETIGGQKNVWYKVRLLDGTEGWFFGAFVHNLYDGPNGNPPPWPNVPDW